jgi:hypothetical protein
MQLTFLRIRLQIKKICSEDVVTWMVSACKFNISFLYSVSHLKARTHARTHTPQQKFFTMIYWW